MSEVLVDTVRAGDAAAVGRLLDADPGSLDVRTPPHGWSLLHHAAHAGQLAVVDLLLARGLDPNLLESGDTTSPMHWAAAGGHVEVVRRLADAGGDVVGAGDDHALEVIGWATCWGNRHAAVAEFLLSRGARHHVFSAIALGLADEVRRIVAADPAALNRRLTRNDGERLPLHHAVMNDRPAIAGLLLELGADPLAVDGSGQPAAIYATTPGADRPIMEVIRQRLDAELQSASRGHRDPELRLTDVVALLALGEWDVADAVLTRAPSLIRPGGGASGALHLAAKRGDLDAARWLLDRGADPNGRWAHWDAEVTPLHLAAAQGHAAMVRLLLDAGSDPAATDGKHHGTAAGWAEHGRIPPAPNWREVVRLLE